jgi:hypothetical protein
MVEFLDTATQTHIFDALATHSDVPTADSSLDFPYILFFIYSLPSDSLLVVERRLPRQILMINSHTSCSSLPSDVHHHSR